MVKVPGRPVSAASKVRAPAPTVVDLKKADKEILASPGATLVIRLPASPGKLWRVDDDRVIPGLETGRVSGARGQDVTYQVPAEAAGQKLELSFAEVDESDRAIGPASRRRTVSLVVEGKASPDAQPLASPDPAKPWGPHRAAWGNTTDEYRGNATFDEYRHNTTRTRG